MLFSKVKVTLKSKHFELIQDTKEAMNMKLETVTKEDFTIASKHGNHDMLCVFKESDVLSWKSIAKYFIVHP